MLLTLPARRGGSDKSEDKEEIQWKCHFISYLAPTPTTAINMSEMSFSSGRVPNLSCLRACLDRRPIIAAVALIYEYLAHFFPEHDVYTGYGVKQKTC